MPLRLPVPCSKDGRREKTDRRPGQFIATWSFPSEDGAFPPSFAYNVDLRFLLPYPDYHRVQEVPTIHSVLQILSVPNSLIRPETRSLDLPFGHTRGEDPHAEGSRWIFSYPNDWLSQSIKCYQAELVA